MSLYEATEEGKYQTTRRPVRYYHLQQLQEMSFMADHSAKISAKTMNESANMIGKGLFKKRLY